jgi:hypothetical protein
VSRWSIDAPVEVHVLPPHFFPHSTPDWVQAGAGSGAVPEDTLQLTLTDMLPMVGQPLRASRATTGTSTPASAGPAAPATLNGHSTQRSGSFADATARVPMFGLPRAHNIQSNGGARGRATKAQRGGRGGGGGAKARQVPVPIPPWRSRGESGVEVGLIVGCVGVWCVVCGVWVCGCVVCVCVPLCGCVGVCVCGCVCGCVVCGVWCVVCRVSCVVCRVWCVVLHVRAMTGNVINQGFCSDSLVIGD